jgi:large subunit ribosomal protein L35
LVKVLWERAVLGPGQSARNSRRIGLAKVAKVKTKLKTHKGAAKRFKLTGTGRLMRRHSFARHILTSKPSKRKRRLGQSTELAASDAAAVRRMLPYGL